MQEDASRYLAVDLAGHIDRARGLFRAEMVRSGLHRSEGWAIREEIRSTYSKTLIIFRPIHLTLDPPDLEFVLVVAEDGRTVEEHGRG